MTPTVQAGKVLEENDDRSGILVVRAWTESDGLRARLTYTSDATKDEKTSVAVATIEDAVAVVAEWLRLISLEPS